MSECPLYEIVVFDDGLQMYRSFENKWRIVCAAQFQGRLLGGKVTIEHASDRGVAPFTISEWKLRRV